MGTVRVRGIQEYIEIARSAGLEESQVLAFAQAERQNDIELVEAERRERQAERQAEREAQAQARQAEQELGLARINANKEIELARLAVQRKSPISQTSAPFLPTETTRPRNSPLSQLPEYDGRVDSSDFNRRGEFRIVPHCSSQEPKLSKGKGKKDKRLVSSEQGGNNRNPMAKRHDEGGTWPLNDTCFRRSNQDHSANKGNLNQSEQSPVLVARGEVHCIPSGSIIHTGSSLGYELEVEDELWPVCEGIVNGAKVKVLRGSGQAECIMRSSLVLPQQIIDKHRYIRFADGKTVKTATAKVSLDTPYFTGKVEVQILDNPLFDVIIGNIEGARTPFFPDPHWGRKGRTPYVASKDVAKVKALHGSIGIRGVSGDPSTQQEAGIDRLPSVARTQKGEALGPPLPTEGNTTCRERIGTVIPGYPPTRGNVDVSTSIEEGAGRKPANPPPTEGSARLTRGEGYIGRRPVGVPLVQKAVLRPSKECPERRSAFPLPEEKAVLTPSEEGYPGRRPSDLPLAEKANLLQRENDSTEFPPLKGETSVPLSQEGRAVGKPVVLPSVRTIILPNEKGNIGKEPEVPPSMRTVILPNEEVNPVRVPVFLSLVGKANILQSKEGSVAGEPACPPLTEREGILPSQQGNLGEKCASSPLEGSTNIVPSGEGGATRTPIEEGSAGGEPVLLPLSGKAILLPSREESVGGEPSGLPLPEGANIQLGTEGSVNAECTSSPQDSLWQGMKYSVPRKPRLLPDTA